MGIFFARIEFFSISVNEIKVLSQPTSQELTDQLRSVLSSDLGQFSWGWAEPTWSYRNVTQNSATLNLNV